MSENESRPLKGSWMSIGISLGVAIGVTFGVALDNFGAGTVTLVSTSRMI